MQIYTGTSGFSYKEWKGPFYPENLKNADMLAYYGQKLTAVEINNTFYRMPKASVLEGWAEQVPESFRFVLKASRRITHFARLKEDSADSVDHLFRMAEALGDRLGPVLFQLPPNFKLDLARLQGFLARLPEGRPVAFEFRHQSWFEDPVFEALSSHNVALCLSDQEGSDPPRVTTADWGYLRLRRMGYSEDELTAWAAWIGAQSWRESFAFFKHEDEGAGPRLAQAFHGRFAEGESALKLFIPTSGNLW